MKKPKNNVNDLLAAIQRKTTSGSSAEVGAAEAVKETPEIVGVRKQDETEKGARSKKAKNKVGKPVQFWMHDEDRKLVRELSAWLAGQGLRPSDSMVIRAALRFAETGSAFLEAYWEASRLDGRLKRD